MNVKGYFFHSLSIIFVIIFILLAVLEFSFNKESNKNNKILSQECLTSLIDECLEMDYEHKIQYSHVECCNILTNKIAHNTITNVSVVSYGLNLSCNFSSCLSSSSDESINICTTHSKYNKLLDQYIIKNPMNQFDSPIFGLEDLFVFYYKF